MADNKSTKSIVLPFEAKIDGLAGLEKLNTILDGIEQTEEEIDKLRKSGLQWAKEDADVMEAKLNALKEQYQIEESISKLKEKTEGHQFDSLEHGEQSDYASPAMQRLQATSLAIAQGIKNTLVTGIQKLIGHDSLEEVLSSAWDNLQSIVSGSYLTSSTTRSNVLGYGLSLGQSYGLNKALSATGIDSVEDLLWASPTQSRLFSESFERYTERYNKLYDQGFFDKQLEYNMKLQEFKDDIELKFMEFFISNQGTIEEVMNSIFKITDVVIKVLDYLVGDKTAADIVNGYGAKNVSVDVSYNISGNVAKNDILSAGQQTADYLEKAISNY